MVYRVLDTQNRFDKKRASFVTRSDAECLYYFFDCVKAQVSETQQTTVGHCLLFLEHTFPQRGLLSFGQ